MLDFKLVSLATALLTLVLFLCLLLVPQLVFWIFDIEGNPSAYFIARRASILFLGLAVLSYLSRNASPSDLRQAIILAMTVLMSAMALLGLVELVRGYAGPGILLAVITELTFALAYGFLWKEHVKSI